MNWLDVVCPIRFGGAYMGESQNIEWKESWRDISFSKRQYETSIVRHSSDRIYFIQNWYTMGGFCN